ncbi:type I restriction-modification system subunit M [Luminiphilus sp.]|nr:type I restriction-modification system subunit M [Luminiphilus sp.]
MPPPTQFDTVVSFIWAIADLLNGAFKKSEFQKIILPFTVLRRLDYALESTKEKVLKTEQDLKAKGLENRHKQLCRASGYAFYNTSKFNYESLLRDDAHLARNLRQYILGFSSNVREIFEAFNFDDAIRDLEKNNLLYLLMDRFNERSKVDLRPGGLSNHEMGLVFEHLLRKFNEAQNENPGEHFTPRDAIRLLVDAVLMFDEDLDTDTAVSRTINDCCCGTGGILSIGKEHILEINPQAKVHLYGQELNPQTWAVARSDFFMLEPDGKDAENIKLGSSLSDDQLANMTFDYQFVNPPYGMEWSKDERAVKDEAGRGFDGRFGAGLPSKSDGQMLFLQHFINRMHDPEEAQSYIGIIMNGSPLFTGGAGSGPSEIRRWVFENDWLEAIIAMPQQIFYNTGIGTYIWILSNRKPDSRRQKVSLIDASGDEFWTEMPKSLGNKRREISDECKQKILKLVKERKEGPHVRVLDSIDFGYREIKVQRPLRLRFGITAEVLEALAVVTAFRNLAISKKKNAQTKAADEAAGAELQKAILAVLQSLNGQAFLNREKFVEAVKAALEAEEVKIKAPMLKAIVAVSGKRDDRADVCVDKDGKPEPDKELTDTEIVPLAEKIDDYFQREVVPHVSDAWVDETYTDETDGELGRIGYEIPFNRHFYAYMPPRELDDIDTDLKRVTDRVLQMIQDMM